MKKKLFLFACLILGLMTSCENKDKEPTLNEENGHEWVDLGLSVKWATCNVGATKPEEYGDYFAWGETTPKATYTKENYTYKENPKSLPLSVDAANANWGGNWRMPTTVEIEELIENCTWTFTWTEELDLGGYKVTSKINGKSIFLPTAEVFNGESADRDSQHGYGAIMSCTNEYFKDKDYEYNSAHCLIYHYSSYFLGGFFRQFGVTVRPVLPNDKNQKTISFDSNGASGKMESINVTHAESIKLPTNTFVKEGYELLGWDTKADGTGNGYAPEDMFSTSSDITLYAQWVKNEISGKENGYEYVDLGLPSGTKWATMNVGAISRWETGYPFAWGETSPKTSYTEENYTYNKRPKTLPLSDDAANVNWGGVWRMPTEADYEELIENCTMTPLDKYNQQGYIVTSKINGNAIYLIAVTGYEGSEPEDSSESYYAEYLTSSYDNINNKPIDFVFHPASYFVTLTYRVHKGKQVRAVFK